MVSWVRDFEDVEFDIICEGFDIVGHSITEDGEENEDEYIYRSRDGKLILIINMIDAEWWLFLKRDKKPPLSKFKKVDRVRLRDDLVALITDGYFTFIESKSGYYWRCDSGEIPDDDISTSCSEEDAEMEIDFVLHEKKLREKYS